jgi:hypothetical protein
MIGKIHHYLPATMNTYSIKISYPSGVIAYMSHKGKTEWCKRTAQKHLREWVYLHGITAELIKND